MNVRLYNNFSDTYSLKAVKNNTKLKDSLKGLDFSKYTVIVNGEFKTGDYIPKENDIILIRNTPRGFEPDSWEYWTLNFLTGFIYGSIQAGVNANEAKEKLAKLQKEMENASSEIDNVNNAPYIAGASNSIAMGKTQPYFIGEHLMSPYVLNSGGLTNGHASGYHKISGLNGKDSFYFVILEGGFNKQVLRSINCENVRLKTWPDSLEVPQNGVYNFDENSAFYDVENVLEIIQDGSTPQTEDFRHKIIEKNIGQTLDKADRDGYEPLIFTCERNTMAADITISFNGLCAYGDKGARIDRTINVYPAYSLDDGETWQDFYFDQNGVLSNTFTYNTTDEIRFNAHIDFNFNKIKNLESVIKLRLSTDSTTYDGSAYDNIYCMYTHAYIYNAEKSKAAGKFVPESIIEPIEAGLSTVIGLKIKASKNNENLLNKINIISSGIARTWDGEKWSVDKKPTSNIAAWLLEILTSETHSPSACDIDIFNGVVTSEEIDLESFGAWYKYCDDNDLAIDMVLTEGQTKEQLIEQVLDLGNAIMYNNIYGLKAIAIDQKQENAITILNPQNVVSFDWEKDLSRETDGIKCTYVSRDAGYNNDTYLVMRDGKTRDAESLLRERTVNGIVRHSQVVKYCRRIMAIEKLRCVRVNAEVGAEGIFYTPYSKVLVQHPALKIGLGEGAEIKKVIYNDNYTQIIGLELYDAIEYDNDARGYGVIIHAVNGNYSQEIARAYTAETNGRVYKINFITPLAVSETTVEPRKGDVLSYGYLNDGAFNTIADEYIINSIEPGEKTVKLGLLNYNEAIFDAGAIPEYTPNITQPRATVAVETPVNNVTLEEVKTLIDESGGESGGKPDDLTSIKATAEENGLRLESYSNGTTSKNLIKNVTFELSADNGNTWRIISTVDTNNFYNFDRDLDGYPEASDFENWKIRAKGVNIFGEITKNYTYGVINAGNYGTWLVKKPTISVIAEKNGFSLNGTINVDSNTYGGPFYIEWTIKRPNNSIVTTTNNFYVFDRDLDGYPEASDFENWKITAKTKSSKGNESTAAETFINISNYGSWNISTPNVKASVSGRSISLIISQPARSDGREIYGIIKNKVQIKRSDESSYFKPATTSDPYASESNYKDGSGFVYANDLYQQITPLKGQNAETGAAPENTTYNFSIVATNESGKESAAEIVTVTALATSAYDIVNATITENKIATSAVSTDKLASNAVTADKIAAGTITADKIAAVNLAANGATFGQISGNAVNVDSNNYWQLSTDPNKKYEVGEFRIGNDIALETADNDAADYIHYKPSTGLLMKIKKFLLKTIGAIFVGPVYYKASATTKDSDAFMIVNPTASKETTGGTEGGTLKVNGSIYVKNYTNEYEKWRKNAKAGDSGVYTVSHLLAFSYDSDGNTIGFSPFRISIPAELTDTSVGLVVGNPDFGAKSGYLQLMNNEKRMTLKPQTPASGYLGNEIIIPATSGIMALTTSNISGTSGGVSRTTSTTNTAYPIAAVNNDNSNIYRPSAAATITDTGNNYGVSLLTLGNSTVSSSSNAGRTGKIRLYSNTAYYIDLYVDSSLAANRTIKLPTGSGTLLTSNDTINAKTAETATNATNATYATYLANIGAQTSEAVSGSNKYMYATSWNFNTASTTYDSVTYREGYIKFSGGLKIMWGFSINNVTSRSTQTINGKSFTNCHAFPIGFSYPPSMSVTFLNNDNSAPDYEEMSYAVSGSYWRTNDVRFPHVWVAIGY